MQQQTRCAARIAIKRIAKDGMTDGLHVDAQLVGAAGDGFKFDTAIAAISSRQLTLIPRKRGLT